MRHYIKKLALLAAIFTLAPMTAHAGEQKTYKDGDVTLEGYFAPSECGSDKPAPLVLVVHQWMGLTDYEKARADMLAKECYHAFAVDMYGQGVRPTSIDEASTLSGQFKSDAALARRRITAGLDFARTLPGVATDKVGVIGYCFGGTMALELARAGADIKAAIPFHAGLGTPQPASTPGAIKASLQVHHGADDPFVKPEEVNAFIAEMNAAKADFEFTSYSGAVHSFTQKGIEAAGIPGAAYNEKADQRSWRSALAFLKENLN